MRNLFAVTTSALAIGLFTASPAGAQAQPKKPNIVVLMTDDTGWNDFGYMPGGGKALGHPTPNIDRIATEGTVFTNWYGQASCTAGLSKLRVPKRSAGTA
jgi:arylsulfatase